MPIPTDGSQNYYSPWSVIGYRGFILLVGDDLSIVRAKFNIESKEMKFDYYFNPKDGADWIFKKKYSGVKLD